MIKNGYLVCPCLIGGSILTYNVTSQNDQSKNVTVTKNQYIIINNKLLPLHYLASYDSKGYKTLDKNNWTKRIGYSFVYLVRRDRENGSVNEKNEKLVRVHFNQEDIVTRIDFVGDWGKR